MLHDWRYVSSFVPLLRPASSQKPRIDSIDQSELVRKTVISGNIVKFAKRFLSLQKLAT